MNSDFQKAYSEAAAQREREKAALARAAGDAQAQRELANELAGPTLQEFSRNALAILKQEGVWCKDSWLLPHGTATFTLNKYASGAFRKHWDVGSSGFLRLTKRGELLGAGVTLGTNMSLEQLRQSNQSDYGMGYKIFYNTDTSQLSVVGANSYGPQAVSVSDFTAYGARSVEALVYGWHNRKR